MNPITGSFVLVVFLIWAIITCSILTSAIRVFFLLASIIASIFIWIAFQRLGGDILNILAIEYNSHSLQYFATAVAVTFFAIVAFSIIWLSYSLPKKPGVTSLRGMFFNVLMSLSVIWAVFVGFSYAGSLAKMEYYKNLAIAHQERKASPSPSPFVCWNEDFRAHPIGQFLLQFDPFDNVARTNLACIVSYGCTRDRSGYEQFFSNVVRDRGIPHPSRLLDLFEDEGMRLIVQQGKFAEILHHSRLDEFLYEHAPTQRELAMGKKVRTTEAIFKEIPLIPIRLKDKF